LRLRYGLWNHAHVPPAEAMQQRWQNFTRRPLPPIPGAKTP